MRRAVFAAVAVVVVEDDESGELTGVAGGMGGAMLAGLDDDELAVLLRCEERGRWNEAGAGAARGSAVVVDEMDDVDWRGLTVESDKAVAVVADVAVVLPVAVVLAVASDVVVTVLAVLEREGEYEYASPGTSSGVVMSGCDMRMASESQRPDELLAGWRRTRGGRTGCAPSAGNCDAGCAVPASGEELPRTNPPRLDGGELGVVSSGGEKPAGNVLLRAVPWRAKYSNSGIFSGSSFSGVSSGLSGGESPPSALPM